MKSVEESKQEGEEENDVDNFIPHSLRRNYTPKRDQQPKHLKLDFKDY